MLNAENLTIPIKRYQP